MMAQMKGMPQLLAILRQKMLRQRFFWWRDFMPHIVAQIIADGHHIANHTWPTIV